MNQIVKINASEYGLEETKAQEVAKVFQPMLDKMVELEKEYNKVVVKPISEALCEEAKALRQKYVKVRTGTAKIHKDLKAFYLSGGRFVDGWKNAQLMASQGIEDKLSAIEKHYENIEKERLYNLQQDREAVLVAYTDFLPPNLCTMSTEAWDKYINDAAFSYQARIDAEAKAEAERIEQERLVALERDRRFKTSRLVEYIPEYDDTRFAHMTEAEFQKLVDNAIALRTKKEAEIAAQQAENERLKKEAADKQIADAEAQLIRDRETAKREAKERLDREVYEAELRKEREAREEAEAKAQAEIKAREDMENSVNDLPPPPEPRSNRGYEPCSCEESIALRAEIVVLKDRIIQLERELEEERNLYNG